MEHYAVTAQFGHVGRNKYIPKTVPVCVENGKKAAEIVRWMPRAKHHRKDAIIEVKKISREKYLELLEAHKNDPYFQVESRQEQKKLCIDIEKLAISYEEPKKIDKTIRRNRIKYKKKMDNIVRREALRSMRDYDVYYDHEEIGE